jgi:outer membrane protein assembly factor BamB
MKRRMLALAAALVGISFIVRTTTADDWPQWRGPNRDGRSAETGLLSEWPKEGPKVVWKTENAGVGYASLAVKDGRVFTQGDLDGVEHVICYSAKDGAVLWAVQPEPLAKALDARVESQFEQLDKNRDGNIDDIEAAGNGGLTNAEAPSDGNKTEIAQKRADWLFLQLDKDTNGKLVFTEVPQRLFNDLYQRADRADKDADVEALVNSRVAAALMQDTDGDRQISQQEARGTLLQMLLNRADSRIVGERRGDGQLTEDELRTYFTQKERGKDGEISKEELQRYYAETHAGRDGVFTKADVRRFYGGYRNSFGDGPRGTPTVDGDVLYTEGGNGDVTCFDADTGKTIWHINLVDDLGGRRPGWGYCESPLVVNDWLIVTPGDRNGAIAALNKSNGEVVWRSEEVAEGAQYASPVIAKVAGQEQIVQFGRNSVFGVSLADGKHLWSYSGANNGTANVCTPIVADDHVLASSSYGKGSGLVKITNNGDVQKAEEVYFESKLANHHGGIVKVGDHVYGFGGNSLICMNFLTGEIAWEARSVSKGSLTFADGHLYCLGERNELALVEATPEKYIEKGRIRLPKTDRASWAHPVVANGRLYVRDQNLLTCYDIRAN